MLVTMKEILQRASVENYGVAAPNATNEINARAYIEAAEEMNAPIIIDIIYKANADINLFVQLVRRLAEQARVPVAINLDHGGPKEHLVGAIQAGFTSVMVDRSSLPFEDNVREVKEVVDMAHLLGLSVEAELGHVGSAANAEVDTKSGLTVPAEAKEFVERTGVDCLAIAIGTAHGAYPKGFTPHLNFERLEEVKNILGQDYPLVLHGSSGMDDASLNKACHMGINKVNIAFDLFKAAADAVQQSDMSGSKAYDVYNLMSKAAKEKLKEKIQVYGSDNKAWVVPVKGLSHVETSSKEG